MKREPRPLGPHPCEADGSVRIPARDGDSWAWVRIDADLLGRVLCYRWRIGNDGYPCTSVWDEKRQKSTRVALHRLVARAPAHVLVDHVHGDLLDARRCALRFATPGQNAANRRTSRIGCSSRYRGVTRHKGGRWQSGAKHRDTPGGADVFHHAGLFDSEEAAARAYDRLARQIWGRFAVVNFPRASTRRAA